MNTHNTSHMKKLVAAVERGEGANKRSFWKDIGVAFENRDGSWNLRFDYLPARMGETTIQMREFDPPGTRTARGQAQAPSNGREADMETATDVLDDEGSAVPQDDPFPL